MEYLNSHNIIENKEDIVIGDTHGDFTAILNVLNDYLNTRITFEYYDDFVKDINGHLTLNTSLLKHKDFILSNDLFTFNLSLPNVRIILLGDVFDTNNYLTLRKLGEKKNINFKPLNTDAVIEMKDNYKVFGNFVCDYNNEFFKLCQQLILKFILSLEKYVEIRYVYGNHELSSFDYYDDNIKEFIINNFSSYYYNKTHNTFYCHFHNNTSITKMNNDCHNMLNIDNLIRDELKRYRNETSIKKKTRCYFKLMDLKKSLVQVVDMDVIDKMENKYEIMGDCNKIIMKYKSIFSDFIEEIKPVVFVGHWNMDDKNVKDDKSIYFLDRDLSIIHSRTIENNKTKKIGILLNCQYCIVNDKVIHKTPLLDYEFYVDEALQDEYVNENDKFVIFDLSQAQVLKF